MARVQDQSAIQALMQDPIAGPLMQQISSSGDKMNPLRVAASRQENGAQFQLAQRAKELGLLQEGENVQTDGQGGFIVSRGIPGWQAALAPLAGAGLAFALPAVAGAVGGAGGAAGAVGGGTSLAADIAGVSGLVPSAGGGFWSNLVSKGKGLLGSEGLSMAGDVLGGISDTMAGNRAAQGQNEIARDALRIRANEGFEDAQQSRARLLLEQQGGERTAESDAFRKALLARLTQTVGDTTVDRSGFRSNVPTITIGGGLRPSALGDMAGLAGGSLEQAALARLQNPEKRPELAPLEKPEVREAPKGSFWEGLAGAAALGATALGGRKPVNQAQRGVDEVEGRLGIVR
jgi:hypothetical protein